jgi:uncharacterized protein
MRHEFTARHLNVAAFAHDAGHLVGDEPFGQFTRLLEETGGEGAERRVSFSARGEIRPSKALGEEAWLHLAAQANLPLTCQRCLSPVDVPVAFARDFRFVATEELAAQEDETSEEDVLVLHRSFNLLELVEDELIMAMPGAPMHQTCPHAVKTEARDPDFVDEEAAKPNPFAVLGQLKKKGAS